MAALTCLAGIILRFGSPALVPFSILPMMVYLSGLILGANSGAMAMFVYVFLGLLGLPVFASAPFGGLGYVLIPTFGFLLGYIASAYTVGKLYNRKSLLSAIVAVLAGVAVLYAVGLSYLYLILRFVLDRPTNVGLVLSIGFFPFILMDLAKAIIAAWVGHEVVRRSPHLITFSRL